MYVGIIDLRKAVHCCSIEESKHDTTAEGWDGMGCRALNCMHKMEKRLAGDAPQNSLDSHREVSKAGLVHKGLSSSSCSSQLIGPFRDLACPCVYQCCCSHEARGSRVSMRCVNDS